MFDDGILKYSSYLDMLQQERQPIVSENRKVSVSFAFSIYCKEYIDKRRMPVVFISANSSSLPFPCSEKIGNKDIQKQRVVVLALPVLTCHTCG